MLERGSGELSLLPAVLEVPMRGSWSCSAVLLCFLTPSIGFSQVPADPVVPDEAPELSGAFFPYNVTGKKAGNYYCLLTEHYLDPAVLIFVREKAFEEGSKPGAVLADLLKKLDQRVEKNVTARLAVFVVVLMEETKKGNETLNVTTDDDKRDQMEEIIKKWVGEQALTHTIFCLDSASRLKDYALKDDKDLTVILYRRYKVLARYDESMNDFKAQQVEKILTEVKEKLGATRE
jgi:hypothetical protein